MSVFILFLFVVLIGGVLLATSLLYGVNRFLKIDNNSFKLDAIIVFFTTLSGGVFPFLSSFTPNALIVGGILGLSVPWVVGYYLYKHFFRTSVGRFLAAFAVYNVIGLLLLLLALVLRATVFEPILLTGITMTPQYSPGDYIFIEKWDKAAYKGDVVLASIACSNGIGNCLALMRVAAMPGDVVNGLKVSDDEYKLTVDSTPDKLTNVKMTAIVGKPILNLGQTGI